MDEHSTQILAYISKYREKCRVLKQIHSDLGARNRRLDLGVTVLGIVLTAAFTFAGFTGTTRLFEAFGTAPEHISASAHSAAASAAGAVDLSALEVDAKETRTRARVEVGFNSLVLLIFVVSLLTVIYRWKEQSNAHWLGVTRLTQFVGWLDELKVLGLSNIDAEKLKSIRSQYQSIVEQLPPNSDRDYEKALTALEKKEKEKARRKPPAGPIATQSPSPSPAQARARTQATDTDSIDRAFVSELLSNSTALMPVLRVLALVSPTLWLSGGSVRNYVWDWATGKRTPIHDFDVAYFDSTDLSPGREKVLENEIRCHLPSTCKISVKNQARMHLVNNEPARTSLEDAIRNFPETATALATRVSQGELELLAPHGLADLLNLIVRPTPFHAHARAAFERRLNEKKWLENWPGVTIRDEA